MVRETNHFCSKRNTQRGYDTSNLNQSQGIIGTDKKSKQKKLLTAVTQGPIAHFLTTSEAFCDIDPELFP